MLDRTNDEQGAADAEWQSKKRSRRNTICAAAALGGVGLVGGEAIAVVDSSAVHDPDDEFAGPLGPEVHQAGIRTVDILSDQVAVFIVDVEVEIGVPVALDEDPGAFAAPEDERVAVRPVGPDRGSGHLRASESSGLRDERADTGDGDDGDDGEFLHFFESFLFFVFSTASLLFSPGLVSSCGIF